MIAISPTVTGVLLMLHVKPRASRDEIGGEHDGALKVAVTAPPVNGKANAAVIKLLAKAFGVSRSSIEIVGGTSSRRKRVAIDGISVADARTAMQQLEKP